MNEESCRSCRFWKSNETNDRGGRCRRHAPQPGRSLDGFIGEAIIAIADMAMQSNANLKWPETIEDEATEAYMAPMWPDTLDEDWCGDYERLTESADR
jgi:hypothetical protein